MSAKEFRQLYQLIRVVSGESDFDAKSLSMTAAEEEARVSSIFASMDEDGSGTVELSELKQWLSSPEVEAEWPELYDEIITWD